MRHSRTTGRMIVRRMRRPRESASDSAAKPAQPNRHNQITPATPPPNLRSLILRNQIIGRPMQRSRITAPRSNRRIVRIRRRIALWRVRLRNSRSSRKNNSSNRRKKTRRNRRIRTKTKIKQGQGSAEELNSAAEWKLTAGETEQGLARFFIGCGMFGARWDRV